jgi:hypothetical protein
LRLRETAQKIHYFGLGFIQVKMDETTRYHFYTSKLPAIVSDEEVHNHRYDFRSTILKGELNQWTYQFVVGSGNYVKERESCSQAEIDPCPVDGRLQYVSSQSLTKGSIYHIDHRVFHHVAAYMDTITKVVRSDYQKPFAEVIRPKGVKRVCPFSMTVPDSKLWEIVEEMSYGIMA